MKPLRVVLADDEPLARGGLRDLLDAEPGVTVVAEAGDGHAAVQQTLTHRPDVLLLDVQMPELDGFGAAAALRAAGALPAVIFVTAYDAYALEAFAVHAVDYLLKPVDPARLREALERTRELRDRETAAEIAQRIERLLAAAGRPPGPTRFAVKSGARTRLIAAAEVDWIEAAGNYARLHTRGGRYVIRETMASLERRLDPQQFARIHRSTIVNLDRVKEIQPWAKGDYVVILGDGTQLPMTRTYRGRLPG